MTRRRLLLVTLFALAMGFLESAVVVYLRLLYYPQGFDFPLVALPAAVLVIEVAREGATLVMLLTVALLVGRTGWERFAWLCLIFGLWDIAYYLGLKLAIGWPSSLMTWDILFLIPVIWTGPVLAPLITSLALIAGGLVILDHERRLERIRVFQLDWGLAVASLALQLKAYTANHRLAAAGNRPEQFPWEIFGIGVAIGLGALVKVVRVNPRLPRAPLPGSRS